MKFMAYFALAAAAVMPGMAHASTVVTANCTSVAAAKGCLFSGNISNNSTASNAQGYVYAQNQYNNVVGNNSGSGGLITLNYLFDTGTSPNLITGAGTSSGTWSTPGYKIDYMAVKAGDNFVLYKLADLSKGLWKTSDIPGKNAKNLSHIVFFGYASPTGVPEPATWGMLIAGVGMAGGTLRRRRAREQVRFTAA